MIRNLLLIAFIAFFPFQSMAQPLSAYTTFQRQFMVWDNEIVRRIEHLVPLKVKIGRAAIPYIDNSRNFKIYANGGSTKINDGFTRDFQVTDNLITYQNANALLVWDQGINTILSANVEQFYVGDSLVVFFDGVQKEFRAYYNQGIYPIESFLAASSGNRFDDSGNSRISDGMSIASGQLPSVKVGSNTAAYVNYANQFKIFFQGEIIEQEDYLINSFDVGRNTVAYVDANYQFRVFQNRRTRIIDEFQPYNYKVGNNLVAYIANDNNFNIYYNDSIYHIGYLQPEYMVKENVVAFQDVDGYFKAFYQGRIYNLDNHYPRDVKMGYNSIAYVNSANVLKVFTEGQIYEVSSAELAHWQLDYDVILYQFGANMFKVFYKGRTY